MKEKQSIVGFHRFLQKMFLKLGLEDTKSGKKFLQTFYKYEYDYKIWLRYMIQTEDFCK